jgi:hypothetical protein
MMKKCWRLWLGAAALLAVLPLTVEAQQTAKEAEREAGTREQYDKILKQSGMHEILARLEGNWHADNLKVILYGSPPKEAVMKDTLEAKLIMDGMFVETNFTTELGGIAKGRTIMGYNGADKQFWRLFLTMDPRGTWSTGVYIRSKDALVFRGTEHDPVSDDRFVKREVFTFGPDKDKFHFELVYEFADGSEVEVVDGDYRRMKTAPTPTPDPTPTPAPTPNKPPQQ